MSEPTAQEPPKLEKTETMQVFRRLLRMLRPHAAVIAAALVLLLLSMPGELFPAFIWMYVTDYLVLREPTGATLNLHKLISFGGARTTWQSLLLSAVGWLFVVYLAAEFTTSCSRRASRISRASAPAT